jgi:uncharacterized protein YndB with AHSA1/START domain
MDDRIEKRIELKVSVSRLWRALTDHREFGQWFGVKLTEPFQPGRVSQGQITHPGYEHVAWEVTVQALEPERLFSFSWHPYAVDAAIDYSKEPTTLVEFRFEANATGSLLVVTESGFAAIPKERRFEAYRMNDAGWSEQIKNLRHHVEPART